MSINFFSHWWSIQDSFGVVSNFPFQSLSSYIKLELICQSFNLFLWPWEFWNRLVWIRAPGAGVFVGEDYCSDSLRPCCGPAQQDNVPVQLKETDAQVRFPASMNRSS
ncbi:uncharacterized protein LOC7468368 [Populus trichocarpa]|uniref:uncharacterized protein LOC7468368 n=1 Tax=Populus trichocarpa TaxID=3694 RepID=UPI0022781F7E|nr:uncharacterized protein LOC7468368 [Populus trichocarpa]